MATLSQIEHALDHGQLWAFMTHRVYWAARRNGKTKLWKRAPHRFEVPIKMGLKACARIDDMSIVGDEWGADIVISPVQPVKGDTRFVREMKRACL